MTYKEAWCKIVSEISNTYDDEIKEALFILAEAASRQQNDKVLSSTPLAENPYFAGLCKKDEFEKKLKEIKNIPISILDKNT